jgi:Carboxypeptidase regulatory-like domain
MLLALAAPVTIAAQGTGSIHGLVNTIGQDGKPVYLPGAQVSLSCQAAPGASRTTTSDDSGHYSFPGVPPRTCTVAGSMPGFKTATKAVTVAANAQAKGDLVLSLETVQQRMTVSTDVKRRTGAGTAVNR